MLCFTSACEVPAAEKIFAASVRWFGVSDNSVVRKPINFVCLASLFGIVENALRRDNLAFALCDILPVPVDGLPAAC
jgi:hypothetical protein